MKHLAILQLILFAFVAMATAQTVNERKFDYRGKTYVTSIPNSPPSDPAWTPGQGEPPISIGKVLGLADAEYQKTFKTFDAFDLQDISLSKQGPGWMYRVTYLQKPSDVKEATPIPGAGKATMRMQLPLVFYVTFDGKVYAPMPK